MYPKTYTPIHGETKKCEQKTECQCPNGVPDPSGCTGLMSTYKCARCDTGFIVNEDATECLNDCKCSNGEASNCKSGTPLVETIVGKTTCVSLLCQPCLFSIIFEMNNDVVEPLILSDMSRRNSSNGFQIIFEGSLMLGLKNRPETSHPLATLIRKKGGIIYAKSNVPEFAAGSNTFNPLFGITASPYDTTRTAGGSSGGSAAALCCGMGFLATGSDLGGSLRIPASFCGVVGLRPSFGLIPGDSAPYGQLHALNGPMGRNVLDTAILMDAMCLARSDNKTYQSFVTKSRTRSSQRLIFSKDVGGTCHGMMDPEIVGMCRDVAFLLVLLS